MAGPSSTNPKVSGSIVNLVSDMGHGGAGMILLLEWSTSSQRLWVYKISVPYAQKYPSFLFEK